MVCARANQFAMAANTPKISRRHLPLPVQPAANFCHLGTKIIACSHTFVLVIECTADQ